MTQPRPMPLPADARRRRTLLMGLPASMALASPLALVGCGGGGSDTTEQPPPAGSSNVFPAAVRDVIARLPAMSRTVQRVTVALPAGSGTALQELKLLTANNISQVAADGTAGAVLLEGAAQMAYALDAAGRLLAMGLIEPGANTRVDARTTAEALLLIASEVSLAGLVPELALREALRTHPIVLPVQRAVEAAAARAGVSGGDTALAAAIEDALRTMRRLPPRSAGSPQRRRALAVQPLPEGSQSGITAQAGEEYNTVQLRNAFRRRAHAYVSRIGYFDANGNVVRLPAPVAVTDFELDATTPVSFDNLVVAVGDLVAGLLADIGLIDPYQRGNVPWTPVTSEPLALAIEPGDAQASVYQARVIGPGARSGAAAMTAAEQARFGTILNQTLWQDIAVPLIKTVILPLITAAATARFKAEFEGLVNSLLLAMTTDLASLEVSGSYFPETVAALRAGDAERLQAAFWTEFFGSEVFGKLLETGLVGTVAASQVVDVAVRDSSGNIIGVNLVSNAEIVQRNVLQLKAALDNVARVVTIVKAALTVADYSAMAKDWLASSRLDTFEFNVTRARIALSPKPVVAAALAGDAGKAAVTATVQDLDGLFNAGNVFLRWRCSGRNGNLFRRGGEGTNDFESPLANPTHDYFPNGDAAIGENVDEIAVTAFYRNPTTNQRIEMGTVAVPVNIRSEFTLALTPPSGTELPTDTSLSLIANIQPRLPPGATVEWTWTHSGAGTLSDLPPDNVPQDSAAQFATGADDGTTTINVRATVRLPATSTTPERSVEADPVRAVYAIKKGVRTITFEASGGTFACGDPLACGVSEYHAYLVPVMPKARSYSAVFSGFAFGGCNRTETWTAVVRDRGGCRFPITYHPHTSAGPTNTWALWMGWGGAWNPGGGKCIVTITLDP